MLERGIEMSFQRVSGYNTGYLKRNRKSSQKVNKGFVSDIKKKIICLKRTGLSHSIKIHSFMKCITLKITLLSKIYKAAKHNICNSLHNNRRNWNSISLQKKKSRHSFSYVLKQINHKNCLVRHLLDIISLACVKM